MKNPSFGALHSPLPSQSEMQGRKPEEKIQQPTFSHGYAENSHSMRKSRGGAVIGLRAGLSERQFRTPCEISHG